MTKMIDISRALSPTLAPWPGDVPFALKANAQIAEDAAVNLGSISMSLHNGTHADATFHFEANGETMEQMPLEPYVGAAVVVDLVAQLRGARREIDVTDLMPHAAAIETTRRLLLKTNCWPDSAVFPDWIPVLATDVPAWLAQRNLLLLGLDIPSVDSLDSKDMRNHHALGAAGIAIVESLDLTSASAGVYELSALPVKICGGDGAPVRAVLWRTAE